MKNWTIGKRIAASSLLLVFMTVLVGGAAFISLTGIRNNANSIKTDIIPGLIYAGQANSALAEGFIQTTFAGIARTPQERDRCIKAAHEVNARISETLTNYEKAITAEEDRQNFARLTEKRTAYASVREKYFELVQAGKNDEAMALLNNSLLPAYKEYTKAGDALLEFSNRAGDNMSQQIMANTKLTSWIVALASAFAAVVGIGVALVITRGVNKVLGAVSETLGASSEQVAAASGQVSSTSQSLAEGASEQAASLEETSSSLEEMSSMTQRNAENSQKANDLAKEARAAAERGAGDMQAMNQAMDAIKASSDDIAKIIKTIDEIAFQTNILALNAAVEAARAGEAGMGFAVVADEVRSLAQRSAQAAKETSTKIEGAIGKSAQGVEISAKVAKALNDIVAKARQVDELVAEVSNASREQTQGITQINTAVGQMDKVTQSNAANAEECASAAEELNAQAEAMKEAVGELLQLVDGQQRQKAGNGSQPVSRKNGIQRASLRAAQKPAPTNGNGNGHATGPDRSVKPEPVQTTAHRRSEIPLEGHFKEF